MKIDNSERNRLKELKSYCILDTAPEPDFDNITQLIANICQVPIATVSLVDQDREWFKSAYGLTERQNNREMAFCAHAILTSDDIFVVPDALQDAIFSKNPMVHGQPHIRFYAGVPLVSPNGHTLGTLAIKDYQPRTLTQLQLQSLKVLANQVMVQLETRRQQQSLEALNKERIKINQKLTTKTEDLGKEREFLTALLESLSEGIVACDENGKLSLFNHATRDLHGLEEVKLPPEQWAEHYDLYLADGKTLMSLEQIPLFRAYRGEKLIDEELVIAPKNRPIKKVKCNGQPIISPSGNKLGAVVAMSDVTVQKDKEIALAKSEAKLSAIFNQSYLFQGLTEVNGTVIDINDIALDACGYKRHEEMGKKFWETGWWRHDPKISQYVKKVIEAGQNGEVVHAATDYHTASGECRKTEFVLTPIRDELGKVAYLLISGQDVTDRKKSESELASVNRALRLLSLSNELLIRSKNEFQLLTDLCEVIVKTGGYEMAWVGYSYNDPEKSIKPVAHFGNLSHLENIKLSWSEDVAVGKGPAAKTIRGGVPIVVEDIIKDADFAPWLDSATNSGYRGVICLPLIHNNQVFGLVAMYAKNVIQVVDSEIKLLQELADDLSFGIMNIRAQQEKQRFHAALYKMASSVSASIDQNFFIQLTRNMTEATSADAGFVAKLSLEDNPTLQSIAVLKEGVESDYFSFSIKDEACSALMGKDCFVLSHSSLDCLQHLPLITELGAKNCIGQRLTDSTGQAIGVVAVLLKNPTHDIDFICSLLKIFAARASAELDRLNSDRHIRAQASLLDKAQDAIMVRDLNHKVEFWNNGAERLYGWTREEALGKTIVELLYPETNQFYMAMDKLLKGGEWSGEIEQCSKYGEKLIIESHWTLVYNEQGRPQSIFTINTNITDRKVAADKIQYLAFYDPLTSLPNRTLLLDRLKQALSNCARSHHFGALLFIDLDNFKSLNDTLGHDKGDLLLNEIGERLRSCVRESDSVARFGGDEFVIMLENISLDEAEAGILTTKIAEKVLNSLNQPYLLEGYQHQSTASIGITLFSDQDSNVNELFKRADVAMYQAKSAGRNALRFFDPKMQLEISAKVLLESDLRQSLSKQQFLLHYQPQLNDLGRVIGAEALLRWQHPERGMVSPALFIPMAEETRLILSIGHWVLQTACAQLVKWSLHTETSELTLAVNVSQRQLRQPDFVEQVFSVLDEFGVNPRKLKLELTESLFAENVEDIIKKMHLLKNRGISFSLDDFGTGYSSLTYLKRMPLDQLKIDQSFVRDILIDPNDASIAQTIIALAQSLGLEVIAEGVETEAQRAYLHQSGCHLYQGYLFSKPLPCEQFEEFLVMQNSN